MLQEQLASIKVVQDKLLAAHDKSKMISRSADMMEVRGTMQVLQCGILRKVFKTCLDASLAYNVQDHMDEVSKTAHSVKTRLELLQQGNQAALEHKARSTLLHNMELTCAIHLMLRSELAGYCISTAIVRAVRQSVTPSCAHYCYIALLLHSWAGPSYVLA